MKRIFLLSFSILGIVSFAQTKKASPEEVKASQIIGFSNSIITLSNNHLGALRGYESIINTAERNIKTLSNNISTRPFFVNCQSFEILPNQLTEYNTKLKTTPAFDDKTKIQSAVASAQKNSKEALQWCKNVSNYFSKETYKTDAGFTQFPAMQDSLINNTEKTFSSWQYASKLASNAGNKAELLLLKGSKIGEFVIPMKSDLIAIDDIINDLNNENISLSDIKEQIKTIQASIEKNKDISTKNTSKLSDVYYKEVYQNFYRESTTCVSYIDSFVQKIEQKAPANDLQSLYSYISSAYNKMVENYNTFISQ